VIEADRASFGFDIPGYSFRAKVVVCWAIHGDLGVFYYSEITGEQETTGPLLVGPVPATDPVLPVSIRLDRDGPALTHAAVVDVDGVVSEFELTRAAR
jgi:hypothetical protein